MSTVTEAETRSVLAAINATFPQRFPLSAANIATVIQVWHALLKDLPAGHALAAAQAVLTEAQHPPAPSEIRRRALASKLDALGGADAWGEVLRAIGSVGMNRIPQWSSPAIADSVAAIGGWRAICTSTNPAADRAQFIRHFDANLEAARQRVLSGAAPSLAEAHRERTEQLKPAPVVAQLLGGQS